MSEQIKSKNQMFEGMLIDKPKQCLYTTDGLMICPNCNAILTMDDCDICGAEDDCLFCNQCNKEFHM
jgi:uncharacterized protein YbaR (Trm112 family)